MNPKTFFTKLSALGIFIGFFFLISYAQKILGSQVPLITTVALVVSVVLFIWLLFRAFTNKPTMYFQLLLLVTNVLGVVTFGYSKDWNLYLSITVGLILWIPGFFLDLFVRKSLKKKSPSKDASKDSNNSENTLGIGINIKDPSTGNIGMFNLSELFKTAKDSAATQGLVANVELLNATSGLLTTLQRMRDTNTISEEQFQSALKKFGLWDIFNGGVSPKEEEPPRVPVAPWDDDFDPDSDFS